MIIENLLPSLFIAVVILAIVSVALVQFVFGHKEPRLCLYSFTLLTLASSAIGLNWLERSGQIHSNQDNTSIFVFICLLLAFSALLSRRIKTQK